MKTDHILIYKVHGNTFSFLASSLSLFILYSTLQPEWSWKNLTWISHTSLQISPMASHPATSESLNPLSLQQLTKPTHLALQQTFVSNLISSPFPHSVCSRYTFLYCPINTWRMTQALNYSLAVSSARILQAVIWTLTDSLRSFRSFYKCYFLLRSSTPYS